MDNVDLGDLGETEHDRSQVGKTETREVQSRGRLDVPDRFLREHGFEQGDEIAIVCQEDGIKFMDNDVDAIARMRDKRGER